MAIRPTIVSLLGALAVFTYAAPALGQTIGSASTVRNSVVQVKGTASSPIGAGDSVVRDEVVRTGAESATKLVFKDSTNLAVGPTSTVRLDRFVFADDNSASKVSVNLVRGAFRFTTGGSDKRAYEIRTPVATIGVRGTVFDVSSQPGRTIVRLEQGEVIVCTRSRSKCTTLSNPGDTVIVTAKGVSRTTLGGPGRFTFAAFCGVDGLCSLTQFASNLPNEQGEAVLCGR